MRPLKRGAAPKDELVVEKVPKLLLSFSSCAVDRNQQPLNRKFRQGRFDKTLVGARRIKTAAANQFPYFRLSHPLRYLPGKRCHLSRTSKLSELRLTGVTSLEADLNCAPKVDDDAR